MSLQAKSNRFLTFEVLGMTIQMKDIEKVLVCYCLLCILWIYLFSLWMKSQSLTIPSKTVKQYSPFVVYYAVEGGSNF